MPDKVNMIRGRLFGYDNIPARWIDDLRERDKVEMLLKKIMI